MVFNDGIRIMQFVFLVFIFYINLAWATTEDNDCEIPNEEIPRTSEDTEFDCRVLSSLSPSELVHVISSPSIKEGLDTLSSRFPSILKRKNNT